MWGREETRSVIWHWGLEVMLHSEEKAAVGTPQRPGEEPANQGKLFAGKINSGDGYKPGLIYPTHINER